MTVCSFTCNKHRNLPLTLTTDKALDVNPGLWCCSFLLCAPGIHPDHLLATVLHLINVTTHSFKKYVASERNPASDYVSYKTNLMLYTNVISRRQGWKCLSKHRHEENECTATGVQFSAMVEKEERGNSDSKYSCRITRLQICVSVQSTGTYAAFKWDHVINSFYS